MLNLAFYEESFVGGNKRKRTKARSEYGNSIHQKRYVLDWSIEKLAEKIDLHPNYVGSLERGETYIARYSLSKIAKISSISLLIDVFGAVKG